MDTFTLLLFIAGLVLLIGGAEILLRGATRLAAALGISPLVIGLTVVAFGTSSPELAVTIQSAWAGQGDIALGNVVGSNICNVLLILGLSALITPLVVLQKLIWLDVPLMIGLSFLMLLMGLDGFIGRFDGAILFTGIIIYTVWSIRQSRRESRQVKQEYTQEYGSEPSQSPRQLLLYVGLVIAGLILLTLGSNWLVEGAIALARTLGVSELLIGLTIIAVGTSLPEVAASVMASLKGERDIAVGNVIGSNIFNILSVLGLTSLVTPGGVNVPETALHFDIPVMIATAVACLPIFFSGHKIARWEGGLLFGYYLAYTLYLILKATNNTILPAFTAAMVYFIIPLTFITLVVVAARAARTNRQPAAPG
ncbi:MAG: sodium:calcium antiporter [Anaerolineae bacterium]|nr:calcium/sodium antiporter [Anaerolineales bacterium]MCQ3975077.1 sodium:calcium antiporter [Anaerolineae bacterium]